MNRRSLGMTGYALFGGVDFYFIVGIIFLTLALVIEILSFCQLLKQHEGIMGGYQNYLFYYFLHDYK